MRFLGRERELAYLESAFSSGRSEFIPLYGRRRVGKSSLILEFLTGKPGLYFVGKQAPAELQQKELLVAAARSLGEPLLAELSPRGWKATLELITTRMTPGKKWILALDEFQWMAESSPELPSVLQELWDLQWSRSAGLVVILCGSYVGFMEREVLGRKSPLFGRRTGQIHLKPFGFREASEFHPQDSRSNQARTYFICGGVPQYLLRFSDRLSTAENIRRELLDEFSPLYREPDFLLREELRELQNYHAILTSLARGTLPMKELAQGTGVPARSTAYYLNQLVEPGYVRKRYPLSEGTPNQRKVRFQLADPLLRFWFRFIFPSQSQIRQLGPKVAFTEFIEPHLPSYFGLCFEDLCREALPSYYLERGVTDFQVGEYWDKQVQIDVVGLRGDHRTDLGECKWGTVSVGAALKQLEEKVPRFPNNRNATIGKHLFVRETKGKIPDSVVVHTLEDLYATKDSALFQGGGA